MIEGVRKLEYSTPYSDMAAYLAAMEEAPFTRGRRRPASRPPCSPRSGRRCCGSPPTPPTAPTRTSRRSSTPRTHARSSARTSCWRPSRWSCIDDDLDPARRARRQAHDPLSAAAELHQQPVAARLRRRPTSPDRHARLVDAIVVCGDVDAVVRRVAEHHDAGADHVCVQVLHATDAELPIARVAPIGGGVRSVTVSDTASGV